MPKAFAFMPHQGQCWGSWSIGAVGLRLPASASFDDTKRAPTVVQTSIHPAVFLR